MGKSCRLVKIIKTNTFINLSILHSDFYYFLKIIMADDALKVKVQLEATVDTKQVQKEATEVADTAQKVLDKKEIKLKIEDNLSNLKKKLEETRVAYQNLLDQPMWWNTNKQLEQLEYQMEDLRNAIKEDEQALNDMWYTSNKTAWLLGKLATKISALAIAGKALSFLKKTFDDFQQSQKTLVMATGASWEELQKLSNVMLHVQWQVAQTQWEIAEAVGELNTRLWLSWEELERFTTKYLKFASVTGQDWKQAIESNVKMFSIWWVSLDKQAEYLDKLVVAWQKTGVSVQNLTSQLQTNAPVLQELWFSLEDSIALLSNFEQAWIEATQVLQSMKMWLKNLADEWVSPTQALNDVIEWVRDWTLSLSDVMDTFWSRWGAAMFNAIKNWTFDLDAMKDSLNNVSGAVEDTYANMETLGEFISRKWNGAVASFVEWNNKWFQATRELWQMLKDELNPAIEESRKQFEQTKSARKDWINWYRELKFEWWQFVLVLNEEWKAVKEAEKKELLLQLATQKLWESRQEARDALDKFNNTKVDDSATRAEFEADRTAALNAMIAFQNAYAAKMKYFDLALDWKGKSWSKRWWYLTALNRDIRKVALARNTWKDVTEEDGGILWDELLWWSWWSGWWGSKSKAEDMLESFGKEMKEIFSDMDSTVKDHQKIYDDLVKNIKKVEEEYWKLQWKADDMWHSLEKSIKSYNEQLEKNQIDSLEKLWQRYIELKEQRAEIEDSYLKNRIGDITDSDWRRIRDEWYTRKWYNYNELKEIKEIYDEIRLIEENTTEEQRQSVEFTERTSKAQEILNQMKEKEAELEEKKAIAMEKQKIAVAVMNQQMWKELIQTITSEQTQNEDKWGTWFYDVENKKREKIHDVDNIEYAKQLEQQFQELNNQKTQFEQEKNDEVEILTTITARKIELEDAYEKKFNESITNQKRKVEELYQWWEKLIAKKNEYYWTSTSARAYGWDISNAKVSLVWENWPEQIIARTASYVQPRNASNSYSTVNNTTDNSFSINWMQINVNNVDDFLDELRQRMTYRK